MKVLRDGRIMKGLACYLVMALFVIGIAERAYGGFSPSEMMLLSPLERATDLQKVQNMLETKVVSEKLKQLGFNKDEIQMRLDQLSDQQLHKLAVKADQIKVGGDGAGFVIAVLVIAILVVLFVYLLRRV